MLSGKKVQPLSPTNKDVIAKLDKIGHTGVRVSTINERDDYGHWYHREKREATASTADGNLVSSRLYGSKLHSVALDIDLPVILLPSSTTGHHHLYIEKPMTWRKYKRFLRALKRAGIIEPGYYKASVNRKATHLRRPGVTK